MTNIRHILLRQILRVALASTAVLCIGCPSRSGTERCGNGTCDPGENPGNCPEDCFCGNGVAEPDFSEECDGDDFMGVTCLDSGCLGGRLTCDTNCRISRATCTLCNIDCGDGIVVSNEECDCAIEPFDLPPGCTAHNGHPDGECDVDCTRIVRCGNGVVDPGEQCDGGNLDGMSCHDLGCMGGTLACEEPGSIGECTFDLSGCVDCTWACTSTDDCWCDYFCDGDTDQCRPFLCGPNGYPNSGDFYDTCTIPGGDDGQCVPFGLAQDDVGLCEEAGTVANGQPCAPNLARPCDDECGMGMSCIAGTCEVRCDPVDVYENETNSDYCPAGTNCFGFSFIYDQDPVNGGCRASQRGQCIIQSTNPQTGDHTCDMTTGELIANRNQVCTDIQAGLMCIPLMFMDGPGYGTRIGACRSLVATVASYWQPCTPGTDICPEGSECFNEDVFGAGTGQNRCIPWCDTTNAVPCYQQHAEVPTDNRCTSASLMFTGGPCTEPAAFHSKLGLCACPVAGCGTGWCGNDVIDGSETCDGSDLGSMNCTNQGCQAGCTLTCNFTCDGTGVTNC